LRIAKGATEKFDVRGSSCSENETRLDGNQKKTSDVGRSDNLATLLLRCAALCLLAESEHCEIHWRRGPSRYVSSRLIASHRIAIRLSKRLCVCQTKCLCAPRFAAPSRRSTSLGKSTISRAQKTVGFSP
jgi:hypothetical protein